MTNQFMQKIYEERVKVEALVDKGVDPLIARVVVRLRSASASEKAAFIGDLKKILKEL